MKTPARAVRSAISRLKDKVERLKQPNGTGGGYKKNMLNGCETKVNDFGTPLH